MEIRIDDLKSEAIANLLQEHHTDMLQHSPLESVHALDLESLRAPDITFWAAWIADDLAGCGALKQLSETHGEIKSMRTSRAHLRKNVATTILQQILEEAKLRAYSRLSLETGSSAPFRPAHNLYQRFGFSFCEPFADYSEDIHSVFMTKTL